MTRTICEPIFTEGNNTPTILRAPTPTLIFGPFIDSALFYIAKYLKDELQQIFKIVLNSRLSQAFASAPVVALYYDDLCKRLLKAWFPDVYCNKTHMEYCNFFQQCKDHFITIDVTGMNQVLFAVTFLKNTALFY